MVRLTSCLSVNDNVRYERRQWIVALADGDVVQLLDPVQSERRPFSEWEVRRLLSEGRLVLCGDTPGTVDTPRTQMSFATDEERAVALQRLAAIRPVLDIHAGERKWCHYEEAASAAAQVFGHLTPQHLRRWVKAYEENGDDVGMLLPKPHTTGRRQRLKPILAKLGPIVRDEYVKSEPRTAKDITKTALLELPRRLPPGTEFNMSFAALYQHVLRQIEVIEYTDADAVKKRHGRRKARALFHDNEDAPRAEFPMEMVQLDHTPFDCLVVDDEERTLLGKPKLMVAADEATHYPLAARLTFAEDYSAVSDTLEWVIMPKPKLVGVIEGLKHDWISCGLIQRLKIDRGRQYLNRCLVDGSTRFGIMIDICAPYCPWMKSLIEGLQKNINHRVAHRLPGTTRSNPLQKGEYKSEDHVCISLTAAWEMIVIYLLNEYAETSQKSLGDKSPRQAWEDGVARRRPRLAPDAQELRILFGHFGKRAIRDSGIEYLGVRWHSQELLDLRARVRATTRKRHVVSNFKIPMADASCMFVEDPLTHRLVRARGSGVAPGTPFWVLKARHEERKEGAPKRVLTDTAISADTGVILDGRIESEREKSREKRHTRRQRRTNSPRTQAAVHAAMVANTDVLPAAAPSAGGSPAPAVADAKASVKAVETAPTAKEVESARRNRDLTEYTLEEM